MAKKPKATVASKAKVSTKSKPSPDSYIETKCRGRPCCIGKDAVYAILATSNGIWSIILLAGSSPAEPIHEMTVEETPTVILNKFAPASLDWVNVSYRGFDSFVAKEQIIAMQSYSSNPAEGTNISLRDGRSFQVSDETVRLFNNVMR